MKISGAKVLVTGGGGFLGSHVAEELERCGAYVYAPRSWQFDLRLREDARRMVSVTRPDAIVHLAASVGGIGANRRRPGDFFYDNMAMGLHVLDAAREYGVAKVLTAGTVCAYPKFTTVPFREAALWDGYPEETNAPYGVAKKALLVMAQAYRAQHGSNFVTVFPANLYGPRDHFDLADSHVIPAMVRKFVDAAERGDAAVTLWGDGSPTREFLYVTDAAAGIVAALARYDEPEPLNLGTGHEIAMEALAKMVAYYAGYTGAIEWDAAMPNGQPRRSLDTRRAYEKLGFTAAVSINEGVRRVVAWYRANRAAILAAEAKREGGQGT